MERTPSPQSPRNAQSRDLTAEEEPPPAIPPVPRRLDRFDRRVSSFMRSWGTLLLRVSLAVVFIWFGLLKPLGLSPAAEMVQKTVVWMPLFSPPAWLAIIGWWEVAIGVCFLWKRTLRLAIALLLMQMAGTLMPLAMLPEVTFQPGRYPYAPTLEGQYIIKNLVILAAATVIGGTVRHNPRPRFATR